MFSEFVILQAFRSKNPSFVSKAIFEIGYMLQVPRHMTKMKKQDKMMLSKKSKHAANFAGFCDSNNNKQMTNEGRPLELVIRISSFGFY